MKVYRSPKSTARMRLNPMSLACSVLALVSVTAATATVAAYATEPAGIPNERPMRKTAHMTAFAPAKDGFKFNNQFKNDFVPALDIHTSGLCGGMSYAALDYYYAKMPVPWQPFRPANGTPLHSYLYDREVTSIKSNLDKWAEIGFNPGGARDTEFFNWGLSAKKGERIDELKSFIDRGQPAVLGLQGDGGTGNHQVIAIGYDMGRYLGDLGAYKEDFKIFICDPNYPGEVRTLVPDVSKRVYRYAEGGSETWRTYFVDKNYHPQRPPSIPNPHYPNNGMVYELVLDCFTGGDDLRGGSDNLNLVVNLTDGTQQAFNNINVGARWINDNEESAEIVLKRPVRPEQIRSLVLSTTFTGGAGGDNWNLRQLGIHTLGGGFFNAVKTLDGMRFTGENKVMTVAMNDAPTAPGQANKLAFTFQTGGDDLRGVNDNFNLVIHFRDGQVQRVRNANGGERWADHSSHTVDVALNRAVAPADITQIDIQTTSRGGVGGDNWDMESVSVRATGNGVDQVLASHGFKRFTGDDHALTIPTAVPVAGAVNQLEFRIRTGGDDLRGGNDNLDIIVRYRDGRIQQVRNANGGASWANNSTHVLKVTLDRAVKLDDIAEVDLQTTSTGGLNGDNWDMASVQVTALGDGINQQILDGGPKRFTGDKRFLQLKRS